MTKIVIYHHLGMGDCIECNGMVRYYAEKYDFVDIFSKECYYDSVNFMYRDNENIRVNKVNGAREQIEVYDFIRSYNGDVLIAGHEHYFKNLNYFKSMGYGPGEAFYHIASVPWEYRNKKFFFQRDQKEEKRVLEKLNPSGEKFIFVHDDEKRGFYINLDSDYKIVKNDPTESFFNMIGILESAEEVHCMSSSFMCLIDCLDDKINIKKKFLHKSVRNVELGPNGLFSDWVIV